MVLHEGFGAQGASARKTALEAEGSRLAKELQGLHDQQEVSATIAMLRAEAYETSNHLFYLFC